MSFEIDVTLDFRDDTPRGPRTGKERDPDSFSPTLRQYHKLLWSKRLPSGELFELSDSRRGTYLYHKSPLGEFFLSSDTVIPSFRKVAKIRELIPSAEIEAFNSIGYTIGGMMVFPGNMVGGKKTINGERGTNARIKDRFDLTVECIRRHYAGGTSPLSATLQRYDKFFRLFDDFRGYVAFFLLQDLVAGKDLTVRISKPFDDFRSSPVPQTASDYRAYRDDAVAFIRARNQRIRAAAP